MKKILAALVIVAAAATPALAQTKPAGTANTAADCQTNFKTADKNGDGMLSKAEMSANSKIVPTTLGTKDSVSKADFLSACQSTAPQPGAAQ
ncbi:MAG: hypothetical protein AB7K67_17355 [Hyphomicrobiaceae bacterium]